MCYLQNQIYLLNWGKTLRLFVDRIQCFNVHVNNARDHLMQRFYMVGTNAPFVTHLQFQYKRLRQKHKGEWRSKTNKLKNSAHNSWHFEYESPIVVRGNGSRHVSPHI